MPGNPSLISPTYGFTEAYTTVNTTLGVALESVTVGAYVENVFNDRSISYVHPEGFLASRISTVKPRTVGLRMVYDF